MASPGKDHIVVVGAGAAGLMAGRELARAGKRVTILEAQARLGGRIWSLPHDEFGYPAEGGAEFVHGTAPVTRALLQEAGLSLAPLSGRRWDARKGAEDWEDSAAPDQNRFHEELMALEADLPIAQFLETRFGGPQHLGLRQSIIGMVEGYDAADPRRASTFALRDEWMGEGLEQQGRIAEGYGALIDFLAADCRRNGAAIQTEAIVTGISADNGRVGMACRDGAHHEADAAVLTVSLPLLAELSLPPATRDLVAPAVAEMGFGNVVKILLRFKSRFWAGRQSKAPSNLSFIFSDAKVPTWWTQEPSDHPVLTGWFAGPKAASVAQLSDAALIDMGLDSLAHIFDLPRERLRTELLVSRAINWGNDPFARGAYSYATPETRAAQLRLRRPGEGTIFLSGEAFYMGKDMGTVEAALASGQETAKRICDAV